MRGRASSKAAVHQLHCLAEGLIQSMVDSTNFTKIFSQLEVRNGHSFSTDSKHKGECYHCQHCVCA